MHKYSGGMGGGEGDWLGSNTANKDLGVTVLHGLHVSWQCDAVRKANTVLGNIRKSAVCKMRGSTWQWLALSWSTMSSSRHHI